MKKTDKIFIFAIILFIPMIITIFIVLSSQFVFSLNTIPIISSNNNSRSQILPISLGSPVIIGKGNITGAAVDPHTGRIYVTYFKILNNASDIYLSRSDDNGKTFSSPVRVNDIKGDATADDTSPPVIKVTSNGDVYVLWAYNNFNKFKSNFIYGYITLRIAHSTDGGNTFSKAVHLEPQEWQVHTNLSGFGNFARCKNSLYYLD